MNMPRGLPRFPVEGGCQCGAVRYRLEAAPLAVYTCHCKDCQRFSGTTHTLSMVIGAEDGVLAKGELHGFDKLADSGRTVRMMGCAGCGTKIWNVPLSSPEYLIVKPGTLDDMSWVRPIGAIWTESRAPWVEIDLTEPNFPGQAPTRQPLIDAWLAAHGD
ncbi:MAG: aldehyde-activating protein [Hyphomicrobiales bacterium]|nr:MAG: aldehyde-activating protein [Hyphomicrobiales bacterium]